MRRISIMVLLASSLIACKGKDDKAGGSAASSSGAASNTGGTAAPATPAAPAAPVAQAVDVCSFAARDQIEGAIGKLSEDPKPVAAQGSLLGGCEYNFDGGMAMVHARPASEYGGTVSASGGGTEIAGLGEKAHDVGKTGIFVQPAGKSYFFHVLAVTGKGPDNEKATAVAKVVTPGAK